MAATAVLSMECHDMFREHRVHLLIWVVQENEDKIKAREKSTVHSVKIHQYIQCLYIPAYIFSLRMLSTETGLGHADKPQVMSINPSLAMV